MEQNFFDEIFEKINILEAENQFLKKELESLNEENLDKYMTIDPIEKLNEFKEYHKKINEEFCSSKSNTDNNYSNLVINFKPFDELNTLQITGDFTNWQKMPMEKVIIF